MSNNTSCIANAAALFIALSAAATSPALACNSSTAGEVYGSNNYVDQHAKHCGQIGVSVVGWENEFLGSVDGPSRTASRMRGGYNTTNFHIVGRDNDLGTSVTGGSFVRAKIEGDGNGAAIRATNGAKIGVSISGYGITFRSHAD